jgi:hypothetical protein
MIEGILVEDHSAKAIHQYHCNTRVAQGGTARILRIRAASIIMQADEGVAPHWGD